MTNTDEIIDRLDLEAEYRALGLRTTGKPTANGWLPVHAIGREDRTASAAINVQTGRYKDHGGDGENLSLFDAAVKTGRFSNWQEAKRFYADKAGVNGNGKHGSNGQPPKAFKTPDEALAVYAGRLGLHTTWYEYVDATGCCAGIVYRWDTVDGKEIRPVSRIGDGWQCCGMPEPRPLYRLHTLSAADTVFVCEGEKAANALVDAGLVATTSPHGAKSADKADWSPLAGKEVVTVPDNDSGGEKYAADVVRLLAKLDPAPIVKMLRLPDLPNKGDADDHIERRRNEGATRDEIRGEIAAMAQEAGPAEQPAVDETEQQADSDDKEREKITYTRITCSELDGGDFELNYLVQGVLVEGQPCLVCGPYKALKTSLLVDLAISLATGANFLGYWPVKKPTRVGIMCGESGLGTLQETGRRVARAAGRNLSDIDGLIWSPDLPVFGRLDHADAIQRFLADDELNVLLVDPAYLCTPLAADKANNVFAMGQLLRSVNDVCQEAGCTLVIAHHMRKSNLGYDPPELADAAWSGWAEWARQWVLLNRREPFDPDSNGEHRLWLAVGGSAGHSGLWGLDIKEGRRDAPDGRFWDVAVRPASDVRAEAKGDRQAEKEREAQAKLEKALDRVAEALDAYPDGASRRQLREFCSMSNDRIGRLVAELERRGIAERCEVKISNHKKTIAGYRRAPD